MTHGFDMRRGHGRDSSQKQGADMICGVIWHVYRKYRDIREPDPDDTVRK